jgi:hypothetical protein
MDDEMELELVISDKIKNNLPELKVESEAREGDCDDDAVTETSDSNHEP